MTLLFHIPAIMLYEDEESPQERVTKSVATSIGF
jgi:hypothetical protein